jgi:phosphatidylglycerophosphate synthase
MTPAAEASHMARRALATRSARWAIALAHWLARHGVRPNAVSVAGVVFAAASSAAFAASALVEGRTRTVLLVAAAAAIQLRLLCNLLDGMIAVEEGFKTKTGDIYNDLPDRLADVLILVGAGYAVRSFPFGVMLGWAAAVTAVLTAYVRLLAGSLGATQHFVGPMAKQHRMFTLTLATLAAAVEALAALPPRAIPIGLAAIVAGSIVTAIRRTARLAREMNAR